MKISVAVVTFRRPNDLSHLLDSLLVQEILPVEIIIVDNGMDIQTENLITKRKDEFSKKGIMPLYVCNKENSLTSGRNLAVKKAKGEIILFLDDDVTLDKTYIAEIVKVYKEYPDALGVQGYLEQEPRSWVSDKTRAFFFWHHWDLDKQRVLKSVSATYPKDLDRIINCECLSGANHSFRKTVFEELLYDENLIKYSEGEDLDMGYRVHCKHNNSLYMTPYARLVHTTSMESRALGKELITMREVYGLYLFFKLFEANTKDKLIYIWSRIGRVALTMYHFLRKRSLGSLNEIKYLIGAYYLCVREFKRIKKGDLEFFNKELTSTQKY